MKSGGNNNKHSTCYFMICIIRYVMNKFFFINQKNLLNQILKTFISHVYFVYQNPVNIFNVQIHYEILNEGSSYLFEKNRINLLVFIFFQTICHDHYHIMYICILTGHVNRNDCHLITSVVDSLQILISLDSIIMQSFPTEFN
jgi:hypothetical protein